VPRGDQPATKSQMNLELQHGEPTRPSEPDRGSNRTNAAGPAPPDNQPATTATAGRFRSASHRLVSIRRISAICSNTLTELTRLKVFYFLLLFGLTLISGSVFLARFSFQQEFQILKDISLGAMSVFTSLLAIVATA